LEEMANRATQQLAMAKGKYSERSLYCKGFETTCDDNSEHWLSQTYRVIGPAEECGGYLRINNRGIYDGGESYTAIESEHV